MTKLIGPCLSLDASGAFGNTVVFSKWKGRNYARLLVTPKNMESDPQAAVRTKLASIGKNNKEISPTKKLGVQIAAVTPADQSWTSYMASTMSGRDFVFWDEFKVEYATAANKALFDAAALTVPLASFELPYGAYGAVTGGAMLYVAAQAAYQLGLAIAPAAAVDMIEAEINAFAAAYKVTAP